ncbi:MAG: hypothetical protein M3Q45_04100, partial [Chloroflexota bacterium]|nr:hypothetical protein [Chloroflexota bacterium]
MPVAILTNARLLRTVVLLLLSSSLLLNACQPIRPASPTAATPEGHLIVADTDASGLTVFAIPTWEQTGRIENVTMADHPGFLALPGGRVLFTDNTTQELLVLDVSGTPTITVRVAIPGVAIHLGVDATLEHALVSTMANEETGKGENSLTMIDLASHEVTVQPIETGEPGLLVGENTIFHRDGGEIGRLQAFMMDGFGTHTDATAPYVDIGAYGHGEALVGDYAYIATDDGIDVVNVAGAEPRYVTVLPWNVSNREGGRGYYMRADSHNTYLWSYLRIVANPEADASWANWQDWQNDAYVIDVKAQTATRFDLGPGLVYRMALSDKYALYSRLHPDGDQAILVDADPTSATFGQITATIDLPAVGDAPVTGVE